MMTDFFSPDKRPSFDEIFNKLQNMEIEDPGEKKAEYVTTEETYGITPV